MAINLLVTVTSICGMLLSLVPRVNGDYVNVGCYQEESKTRDLPYEVKNASDTVDTCVDACRRQYFRYAGLKEASFCFCGSSFGLYGQGKCDKFCRGNSSQPCGGTYSNNIYDTGQTVAGPPTYLKAFNTTETSIQIAWMVPLATNGDIEQYNVMATCVKTYSNNFIPNKPPEWVYSNSTTKAELPSLHPGTQYDVTVSAETASGRGTAKSILVWTQIGEPDKPDVPVIVKRGNGQLVVRLTPAQNNNGPITAYRVVVISENGLSSFQPELLKSWAEAQNDGLSYYISAEILPKDLKSEFVVGDGGTYGNYYNPPLDLTDHIHISLGVVSSMNNVTKVAYATVTHEQHGIIVLNVGDTSESVSSSLVLGLAVAIGMFGFLLLLSVIVYCVLRQRVGARRRIPDHQELSLQGPIIEVEGNSYLHNGFVPDEDDEWVDHYGNLKQKVWNIPYSFLDVMSDSLGSGCYGHVNKGTVQQKGFLVPVAIHTIPDRELSPPDKKAMLRDLDLLIRVGVHENLIHLVGTCENTDTLFVVVEHHPATLKEMLLESRCLEHLVTSSSRFCSLSERQVLEAAIGIAKAMEYLTYKKIVHKQLTASNVLMADGIVPKVSSFGIAQYNKGNIILDHTRWTAQEIFQNRNHVSKSDVWSYGCLLWEMTALGGTPYAEVQSSDVAARVSRGLRLPRLHFVSDDLYQLMLQCWQVDLDERPTFQEITCILDNLVEESVIHMNFEVHPGFHYEQYVPELERQS